VGPRGGLEDLENRKLCCPYRDKNSGQSLYRLQIEAKVKRVSQSKFAILGYFV
jgi:hypothetical protein